MEGTGQDSGNRRRASLGWEGSGAPVVLLDASSAPEPGRLVCSGLRPSVRRLVSGGLGFQGGRFVSVSIGRRSYAGAGVG